MVQVHVGLPWWALHFQTLHSSRKCYVKSQKLQSRKIAESNLFRKMENLPLYTRCSPLYLWIFTNMLCMPHMLKLFTLCSFSYVNWNINQRVIGVKRYSSKEKTEQTNFIIYHISKHRCICVKQYVDMHSGSATEGMGVLPTQKYFFAPPNNFKCVTWLHWAH